MAGSQDFKTALASLPENLSEQVETYLRREPNAGTKKEMEEMVAAGKIEDLREALSQRLSFGTAGLRGRMGAGNFRMNDLTVAQASQGLCKYLEDYVESCKNKGVVIGNDHRLRDSVSSVCLARRAARVFLSRGFKVYLFPEIVGTPFVPYGVKFFGAAAGIMVTASHNPKDDNGFKVYAENGAQIISPMDAEVSKRIEQNLEPCLDRDLSAISENPFEHNECADASPCVDAYFTEIKAKLCLTHDENAASDLLITFTPMHGVGTKWMKKTFEAFGLRDYVPVKQQEEPDPYFSTVKLPNPEEGKGALKLAMESAEQNGSLLILANDPDSDRLAVAERQPNGTWEILNGNKIALLLADWLWSKRESLFPGVAKDKFVMIASTVSSKILKAMALTEGFKFDETLTGFKWIGNKALEYQSEGYVPLLSYEVEIGFAPLGISPDKDGLRSAGAFAELANNHYKNGNRLTERLHELYEKYGFHEMIASYFFCYDPAVMKKVFDDYRSSGPDGSYGRKVGEFEIEHVRDLTTGFDDSKPNNKPVLPVSSSSQMITLTFKNGATFTMRGSGTEPKLKYYLEVVGKGAKGQEEARTLLERMKNAVFATILRQEEYGLVSPSN